MEKVCVSIFITKSLCCTMEITQHCKSPILKFNERIKKKNKEYFSVSIIESNLQVTFSLFCIVLLFSLLVFLFSLSFLSPSSLPVNMVL